MIYCLYGENFSDIDNQINSILKENDITDKITYDITSSSISDVLMECEYTDLFSSKKLVILYSPNFESAKEIENDEFINYINNPNENTMLIIKILSKLDERKKITKLLKEKTKCMYFGLVDEKEIENYSKKYLESKGYTVNKDALEEIRNKINTNTIVINEELNKLILYKDKDTKITKEDIEKVITSYDKENLVFDLTDALVKKDVRKIFSTYKRLTEKAEEPVMLIALIASQIRLILNAKILKSNNMSEEKIASTLKEHPYRIKLALENSRLITEKEAYKLLNLLFELDLKIKTGQIDKYRGLESFLLNFTN